MSGSLVEAVVQLSTPWQTIDPFLFCVHHDDRYPRGNDQLGPDVPLTGRNLGQDFGGRDGWSMYHGRSVPGFPRHPHRGFETVTVARRGFIDHSDSLGAIARFGDGDVQWMTAGSGIVHAEMFPLVHGDRDNPTELFQIWLNLPAERKMVPPQFHMLWGETVPRACLLDDAGRSVDVTVMAGRVGEMVAPAPPAASWAADPDHEVGVVSYLLEPGATITIEAASAGVDRMLYFFRGASLTVGDRDVSSGVGIKVRGDRRVPLTNGDEVGEVLLLQGRPIGEPVAHYGPFVMNERAELEAAFADYRRTGFGGWPWQRDDPVHERREGRFAVHADGRIDRPA